MLNFTTTGENLKKKLFHYLKEILLFIFVITLFANGLSWYKSQDLNKEKLKLKSEKLINSQLYKVEKEKALLVHIWAIWCPTCSLEAANIQSMSKHYNVITIAVKSGSDYEIKQYLDKHNLDFNVINDENGKYAREFNIAAYPTTLIYDKNGNLVFSEVGYTSTLGLYLRMWWASL